MNSENDASTRNNVECLDINQNRFRVLNLIEIETPHGIADLWHVEDYKEGACEGAIFRGISERHGGDIVTQVIVVDGTSDPDEPDIQNIDEESLKGTDAMLEAATRAMYGAVDATIDWMSSSLSQPEQFPSAKFVTTVFRITSESPHTLVTCVRAMIDGRKAVLLGYVHADDEQSVGKMLACLVGAVVSAQISTRQ
ncbi:MAG TPA: hypothetical protein PKK10_11665 [Woeseiaceae bacterium]|nr:hypothetical protein [Woeseiaceae bacterium]